MKNLFLYTSILLFPFSTFFAQADSMINVNRNEIENDYSQHQDGSDPLVFSTENSLLLTSTHKANKPIIKDLAPSLTALLIVLISTGGAIYLGKRQIRNQLVIGKEQIRSQEAQSQKQLGVTREQMKESSSILFMQLENENRQTWIIDTRETIAGLISQINLINVEFQEKVINEDKQKVIHEKISFYKNKLHLLINPDSFLHSALMNVLKELLTTLDLHMLNSRANNNPSSKIGFIPYDNSKLMTQSSKVLETGRKVLNDDWWSKIKFEE